MPKISEYTDAGTPQGSEQFIASRGSTSKKLSFSTIKSYLEARYLALGGGVSNGNSHNHISGYGAQINHTTLSNIGTNTHAQIDTHIDATPGWITVLKDNNQAINNDILGVNDNDLQVSEPGIADWYAFRGRVWFYSNGPAGFVIWIDAIGNIKITGYDVGSTTPNISIVTNGYGAPMSLNGAASGIGLVEFEGRTEITPGGYVVIGVSWAQAAGDPANTTVYKGSWLQYSPMV